jgi:iron-sulfur cluster repair protein YtfE (RIC family)
MFRFNGAGEGDLIFNLRQEYKELLPHVERMRMAADAVGDASFHIVWDLVDNAYGILNQRVLPDMKAEVEVLYPVVGRLMGATEATATMSRDYLEAERLSEELSHLRSQISVHIPSVPQEKGLRRVLYSLHALLKLHFIKEQEMYLPLLDRSLTRGDADDMLEAMDRAADRARQEKGAARGGDQH